MITVARMHTGDRIVSVGAAVAAPIITTLIDVHVISAQLGVDLAAVVAAAVASYHGGILVQANRTAAAEQPPAGA